MKKIILFCLLTNSLASANVFDAPKNLKVLDKDISAEELGKYMKSFAISLGVRCTHCHVGEEGQPLTTYDFASDKKHTKKTARIMMKMVKKMNTSYIDKIEGHSIEIECMTCHRGQATPLLTKDILINEFNDNGIDKTIEHYETLRSQYYGSHSHDFSESMLLDVASEIMPKDPKSAIIILNKNLEHFPKGAQTLFSLGRIHQQQNNKEKALLFYQKAHKVSPNPWLDNQIKQLSNNIQ